MSGGITSDTGDDEGVAIEDGTDSSIKAKVAADGSGDNRVFVDVAFDNAPAGSIPSTNSNLDYDDMNVANGGIARSTSLNVAAGKTQLYEYLGSGVVFGFIINLQSVSSDWRVYFEVDGDNIFNGGSFLTDDLNSSSVYSFPTNRTRVQSLFIGVTLDGDTFGWQGPSDYPMRFTTSVKVFAERVSNPAKNFQAGLIAIQKES